MAAVAMAAVRRMPILFAVVASAETVVADPAGRNPPSSCRHKVEFERRLRWDVKRSDKQQLQLPIKDMVTRFAMSMIRKGKASFERLRHVNGSSRDVSKGASEDA